MNLSDRIEEILTKKNVLDLTLMNNPKAGTIVIQAKQFVSTGKEGNRANVVHQVEDLSLVNAVERLSGQLDKVLEMETKLVHLKTSSLS